MNATGSPPRALAHAKGWRGVVLLVACSVIAAFVPAATAEPTRATHGYQPSQPTYKEVLEPDQYFTMADGTKVRADVARPEAPGRFPVIVWFDVYYKDDPTGPVVNSERDYFVRRGYVFINVASPGSNSSCGTYDNAFSTEEQQAAYDAVEWGAIQTWSNGKVAMEGLSYAAIIEFFAAGRRPPHLVTIYPTSDYNDLYRDLIYTGGLLQAGYPIEWDAKDRTPTEAPPLQFNNNPTTTGVCYATNKVGYRPIVVDYLQHPFADSFYTERSPNQWANKINVPVAMDEGLYDDMLYGGLNNFEEITTSHKRLILGPWTHSEAHRRPDGRAQRLRWLDYYLKGLPSGVTSDPPVQVYIPNGGEDGAKAGHGRWVTAQHWPLPTKYATYYLGGGRSIVRRPGIDGSASYQYLPNDAQLESSSLADGEQINFTSVPFTTATDVVGYPELDLYASSSSGQDTAFNVGVYDVDPAGSKHLLQNGELRAAAREVDPTLSRTGKPYYPFRRDLPVPAGQIINYRIAIWPLANHFDVGHRLLVTVSDSPNGHNGDPYIQPPTPSTITVYFGAAHPSRLLLPTVSGLSPEVAEDLPVSQQAPASRSVTASARTDRALATTGPTHGVLPPLVATILVGLAFFARRGRRPERWTTA